MRIRIVSVEIVQAVIQPVVERASEAATEVRVFRDKIVVVVAFIPRGHTNIRVESRENGVGKVLPGRVWVGYIPSGASYRSCGWVDIDQIGDIVVRELGEIFEADGAVGAATCCRQRSSLR